jgi:hypothetical protein
MKHALFFALLTINTLPLSAQWVDDFSDGDFSSAPAWLGDVERFAVFNDRLQLRDTAAAGSNASFLYSRAPTTIADTTQWEGFFFLNFSPSAANLCRWYLAVNSPPGSGSFTGYYLQLGGVSGNTDALELYRQDGSERVLLLRGREGAMGGGTATVRVAVSRFPGGEWRLLADYSGGYDLQEEGSVTDDTYIVSEYTGIGCLYTASRSNHFFFDDFSITPLYEDNAGPTLLSVHALDERSLRLMVDEPLDAAMAVNPAHYQLDGGQGRPMAVLYDSLDLNTLILVFDNPFINLQSYTLTIDSLADRSGNIVLGLQHTFPFVLTGRAGWQELVISEIMADPSPTVGLPNAEYLELLNRSDQLLELSDYSLLAGSNLQQLPEGLLLPGERILLCRADQLALFSAYGRVAAMSAFPALSNSGSTLSILDQQGVRLLTLSYSISWYRDEQRSDGGYSMEMQDETGPADCAANWRASLAAAGGTPGQGSSLTQLPPDRQAPRLQQLAVASASELSLQYDEALAPESVEAVGNFQFEPWVDIAEVVADNDGHTLHLFLQDSLRPGQIYRLRVLAGIADCLGNRADAASYRLGLPEPPLAGDLIINELLFNPLSGGVDFAEIYNRSDKTISLNRLYIGNSQAQPLPDLSRISAGGLLLPGEYAVFSPSPADIMARYTVAAPDKLFSQLLPVMPDERGNFSLYDARLVMLDSIDYDESWHSPLLTEVDGISLERIFPEQPGNRQDNWHSAASMAGYATPTARNSQFRVFSPLQAGEQARYFQLSENVFSPDGDGYQDFMLLTYEIPTTGYVADVRIYDLEGREIMRLGRRALLAGSGHYQWDGTTLRGQRARAGIYAVHVRYYRPDGRQGRETYSCVLAGQLD